MNKITVLTYYKPNNVLLSRIWNDIDCSFIQKKFLRAFWDNKNLIHFKLIQNVKSFTVFDIVVKTDEKIVRKFQTFFKSENILIR